MLAGIIVVLLILLATCQVALYESEKCQNTFFVMNKLSNPYSFWQIHPYNKSVYRVMRPLEAVAVITTACLFFMGIDVVSKKKVEKV